MRRLFIVLSLLSLTLIVSTNVFSRSSPIQSKPIEFDPALAYSPLYSYVLTVSAGVAGERAGRDLSIFLAPNEVRNYIANHGTQVFAEGEIFLGMQRLLGHWLAGQVGVALASASQGTLYGQILNGSGRDIDNFSYRYHVQHSHAAVKFKLLGYTKYEIIPWLSASFGAGLNRSSDFINMPRSAPGIPLPNFSNHTTSSFSYTVGIGVQHHLTRNLQVGFGYEFTDWGKSSLGAAPTQTFGKGLSLQHLFSNGFLANLTFLMP